MTSAIRDGLIAAGWTSAPPREGAAWRVVRQRAGDRVVAEQRDGGPLWLVADQPGDRRVLGIEPTASAREVVAAIVAVQDSFSVGDYFGAYGDLGAIGDVAIIAWEQFDPAWG